MRRFALILAVLFAACDTIPIPVTNPTGPPIAPPAAPGDPGGLADAPDDPPEPSAPSFITTVSDDGDTLAIASGRVIGVGQVAGLQGRIVVPENRTYGIVIGLEEKACNGTVRLVGIADDGTAGMGRALVPSDALDGWFGTACQLIAFRVPGQDGGRVYDFQVLVEGLAAGETRVKSYFEVQGESGTGFRWGTHSKIEVRP